MIETQIIEHLTDEQLPELSAYLQDAHGATLEHDPKWLWVLREAMDHRTMMLVARDQDKQIVGCVPLALVTSRLFGRYLVSLPYLNRAGLLANDRATESALIDAAVALARVYDVQYLELRHDRPIPHGGFSQQRSDKVRMVLPLPTDGEALWSSIGSKVRNQIRKGEKSELSIRWGGTELLEDFYHVFSINMRDLGTPVYGRRLFRSILAHFPEQAELAVVDYQSQPVACALLLHAPGKGGTQVPSASSLRAFNHTNANMWMYHQLLLRAIERGCQQFDFGRSSEGSGTYRFKKQWGAEPQATVWQYHVRRGSIDAVRPDNSKYKRRIETWQKLPVWVTRLIGPRIVRGIP